MRLTGPFANRGNGSGRPILQFERLIRARRSGRYLTYSHSIGGFPVASRTCIPTGYPRVGSPSGDRLSPFSMYRRALENDVIRRHPCFLSCLSSRRLAKSFEFSLTKTSQTTLRPMATVSRASSRVSHTDSDNILSQHRQDGLGSLHVGRFKAFRELLENRLQERLRIVSAPSAGPERCEVSCRSQLPR